MATKSSQKAVQILACNLVYLRENAGMSMRKMSGELNVDFNRYAKWELGICAPRLDILVELSSHFGVTLDDLLTKYLSYGTAEKVA